jgi:hypothetical protein
MTDGASAAHAASRADPGAVARGAGGEVHRGQRRTGPAQPDAVALYERAGYRGIPCFGAYAVATRSRCHERVLGSR